MTYQAKKLSHNFRTKSDKNMTVGNNKKLHNYSYSVFVCEMTERSRERAVEIRVHLVSKIVGPRCTVRKFGLIG